MDDRSERLRKRRKRSKTRRDDGDRETPSEPSDSSDSSKPSETDGSEQDGTGPGSDDGDVPIKEEQIGTYMYLPETQTKDLRRLYNVLKAEYEFEYDEEFEKNRHFYPLVVQYGLESLDGLDASEIRDRLSEFYESTGQ